MHWLIGLALCHFCFPFCILNRFPHFNVVAQLQLLELVLQLYLLSVGEIELLRKLLLLLQQLSEVPLFAGARLNQLVVHAYLHSTLVLLLIGIQILTVLYPASLKYSPATAQTLVWARKRFVRISLRLLVEYYLRKDSTFIAADKQGLSVLVAGN